MTHISYMVSDQQKTYSTPLKARGIMRSMSDIAWTSGTHSKYSSGTAQVKDR